jgi:hypothetical protein
VGAAKAIMPLANKSALGFSKSYGLHFRWSFIPPLFENGGFIFNLARPLLVCEKMR